MPIVIPMGDSARLAFSPDSRVLAVPQASTVSLFDLATFEETKLLPKMDSDVSALVYSPDGTLLASGSEEGSIRLWSCAGGRPPEELDGHEEQIVLLRFRADGARMLSLDEEGKAIWWDALTWREGKTFVVKPPDRPEDIWRGPDVSPDGRLLAFGTKSGATCWLDADTGKLLDTTPGGDDGTKHVAFSGDGLRLASTSNYGSVALWDPSSFACVDSFRAHLLGAQGVAFLPDGRLATGGGTSRDTVKLWDASTYRELITLRAPRGQPAVSSFVAFSPDGRWLAACGGRKLHLWHAPSWEEIEAEEKRLASVQSL
jgi:WD40 repeat protein